jgi:hypothetical protein
MAQVNPDSIEKMGNDHLLIHQEWINSNLQQINIEYKDSTGITSKNNFYVQN